MSEWKEEEIGKIPEDAILMELGNCIDLIIDYRGKTPKKLDSDWTSEGIRTISAKNVHKGKLTNIEDIRYVTYDVYKKWMKEDLKKGDCLVASEGATLGEHLYWDFDFPVVLGQRLFCIRTNPKIIDSKYFYAFVTSNYFQNQIHGRASGTSVFGLRQTEVLKMLVPIIPIERQIPIGEFHYTVNKKIELLERQNATLEAMAETLFRQWFVEEAKEDWEEGTLEQLVETANTGLDAIRRAPIVEEETGIKCLRIQDISQDKPFQKWGNSKVTSNDFDKARLRKGDIIMARTCSPGIVFYAREDINAVFNNGLARIRPNLKKTYSIFLYYLFKTEDFIGHIYGISDGTSVQLNMKLGDLLSYKIQFPPKEIQDRHFPIFQDIDNRLLKNKTQIRTLTSLRDTLLPKLMSGEVRIN